MSEHSLLAGSYVRPMPGEVYSGDFAAVVTAEAQSVLILMDVAGHGRGAFEVGRGPMERLLSLSTEPIATPSSLLRAAHDLLRDTQGAAVGVAVVQKSQARFAGVGNVRCVHLGRGEQPRSLSSRDGLVGLRLGTPREHEVLLAPRDILLMHSDGVQRGLGDWVSEIHAGSPSSIARAIVDRYGRDSDDASCLVARLDSCTPPGETP